jgi:glycosyltransferase involved in cell wall biosynthesis
MKFVLIAPGYKPFPPNGWGAVESIVWDYYQNLLKRGHDVHIVNRSNPAEIIAETNAIEPLPDVVHIMYDDHIVVAPYLHCCKKILYTSHYAYITHPEFATKYSWYFKNIFMRVIEYQKYITINVISKQIEAVYRKYGFQGKINILHNGAREDCFRYTEEPKLSNKSAYVAKVENRKKQYFYQGISSIDFIGNYHDSPFNTKSANYLGEWDKPTLYHGLTDYANLVLLSDGEADPLVVKEALIAGLGIIVSECACANLDLSLPFITVIPDNKRGDLDYVKREIIRNRLASLKNRSEIRAYGLANFGWNTIIDKYEQILI